MPLIEIKDLIKRYDRNIAVDNINLKIQEGEIFGLLGPNGAGKSTTINMLCGLINPTSGEIIIDGLKISKKNTEYKRNLGLVPQQIAIYESLSAEENIQFFGKLAGLKGTLLKERITESLEFVGLLDKRKSVPKSFSGGMKRRLNIACAIMHHPKIIIMDEPTVGIDPQSRNHILQAIKKLNSLGSTIIYTSHYMEEIQALCSRIAIMDHGKLIAEGTTTELKNQVSSDKKIKINVRDVNYNSIEEIKAISGVTAVDYSGNSLEIITKLAQSLLQDILFILSKNQNTIIGLELLEPNLETVFLTLTGRKLRD
ncbi:ABC transporter ATP-binding protein [Clostridium akagii]|uniref:ABC transporter ATP-binding protein n=1 Tax=Clostridium akagii TaxID=91623 RepID=UPI00047CFBD3|nr:ABC transporter ATP-binding protein [Clostridium akagii]